MRLIVLIFLFTVIATCQAYCDEYYGDDVILIEDAINVWFFFDPNGADAESQADMIMKFKKYFDNEIHNKLTNIGAAMKVIVAKGHYMYGLSEILGLKKSQSIMHLLDQEYYVYQENEESLNSYWDEFNATKDLIFLLDGCGTLTKRIDVNWKESLDMKSLENEILALDKIGCRCDSNSSVKSYIYSIHSSEY